MADMIAQVRKAFFDRDKVLSKARAAEKRVLSKFGAFVRRRARSSIRKRKKASAPGSPPSSHQGQLKNLLFFSWDQERRSVFVGPVPFRGPAIVPGLMERGGTRTLRSGKGSTRIGRYRARPFMGPALAAESPKFSDQLRNIL